MGLFLPSIPEFVPENAAYAAKAYPLKANRLIRLQAHLVADDSAPLLNVLDHYLATFGGPKKLPLPVSYDEVLEKGRIGYMETVYDAKAVGTKHWTAAPAMPYPGPCAVLWVQSLYTKGPARKELIRERIRRVVDRALQTNGIAGLTDKPDGRDETVALPCHVRSHLLPFYVGHLEGGLAAWKQRVHQECIKTQQPDGSWPYKGQPSCKQGDRIVVGTVAELAGCTLMYARVTGERRSLEAGLRALKFMDRFTVPRGGQVWEVPKLTPDILPAGHATWAYLEAYQITGEPRYLKRAKYWAKTGVPFVYLWKAPDRQVMQYATIPVIGATFYRHSWIGRPVQWCGLAYGSPGPALSRILRIRRLGADRHGDARGRRQPQLERHARRRGPLQLCPWRSRYRGRDARELPHRAPVGRGRLVLGSSVGPRGPVALAPPWHGVRRHSRGDHRRIRPRWHLPRDRRARGERASR